MSIWAVCLLSEEVSLQCERAMEANTEQATDVFCEMCLQQNAKPSSIMLQKTRVNNFRIRPLVYALHHGFQHAVDVLLLSGFDTVTNCFGHVLIDDCPALQRDSQQIANDDCLKQQRINDIRNNIANLRDNKVLLPELWDIVRGYWTCAF